MKAKKVILGLFILAILIVLTAQLALSANSPIFISNFKLDGIAPVNEDTQSDFNITGQIFPLDTQPVSDYNYIITNAPVNSNVTTYTTASDVFINATFQDSGSKSFTLTVTDKVNATLTYSRNISASVTVTDSEAFFVNGTQTVTSFDEDSLSSSSKGTIDLSTLIDNDAESDPITYALTTASHNPAQIVCEISGNSLTYYPAKDFWGPATCGVTLTDANSTIVATSRTTRANPTQITFNFNVNAKNDAPEYIATADKQNITFVEDTNKTLDLTGYFKDVDGDTLTYSETHGNGISKVTFNSNTATIEPIKGFDGLTTLVINATDGKENATSGTININITGINNAIPQFTSPFPVPTFAESVTGTSTGTTLNLSAFVTDQDNDFIDLIFSISDITTGLNVDVLPTSGSDLILNITSEAGFDGLGTFILTIDDGINVNAKKVRVNVTGVNQAPTVPILISPENSSTSGVDDSLKVNLVWNASTDLDSSIINYTAFLYETQNVSINQTKTTTDIKWENVIVKNNVEYTWYVDASDGENSSRSESFTFTPVTNFRPVIQSFTPDIPSITINEGESINFITKINDTENDKLTYSWKLKGTEVSTEQNFTLYTGFSASGVYDLVFSVNDGNNTVSRTVNVTVNDLAKVLDLKSKTPSDNELFMAQGTSQKFSVDLNNTSNVPVTYNWTLDGKQVTSTTNSYTHQAPSLTGTQTLKLTVSSIQDGVDSVSSEWKIETRNTPISRSGNIKGSITGFAENQLATASGVTLEKTDIAKIDFGNQVLDLRSVIDLDNFVVLEKNLVAIDSSTFPTLNKPATITLRNLAYDSEPKIFRSGSFTRDGSQVTSECTTCNIVSYTPAPTSSGTVTFTVTGFSTYKVGNAVNPQDLPGLIIERFEVDGKKLDVQGGGIVRDIKPGDNVKVEVKVKNNFNKDIEIQDIEIELFVLEIESDRDDIELDSETFDLSHGRSKTIDFNFDVPTDVEDGNDYKILVIVSGTDEDNRDYNVRTDGYIRIDKDKHNVHIEEFDLTPEIIRCSRSISVDVEIKNRGRDREKDAVFRLVNSDLGIDRKIEFNLDEDPDDQDFEYDESLTFTIPENVANGNYDIVLSTYYDKDRLSNREVKTLTVEECQDRSLGVLGSGDDVVVNVPDDKTSLDKKSGKFNGMSDEELLIIVALAGIALILLTLILIIVLLPKKSQKDKRSSRRNKRTKRTVSRKESKEISKETLSSKKANKKVIKKDDVKKDIGEEQ